MRTAHITSSPRHDPDDGTFRNLVTRAQAACNQVRDVTFLDEPLSAGSIYNEAISLHSGK